MLRFKFSLAGLLAFCVLACLSAGCSDPSSDDIQHDQQEKILQEGTSQVGMPAITNFREKRLLKTIYELRDSNNLITYTYLENEIPHAVPGKTALGGKLTYVGISVGYGIPAATEYTNPMQITSSSTANGVIPQADPNGLFSPTAAEGTWVMMKDPAGDIKPQYVEPRVYVSTYKFPFD